MLIDIAEDLHVVMPMYNLLEYDVDGNASDGKLFKYKTKIVGKTPERLPRTRNSGNVN